MNDIDMTGTLAAALAKAQAAFPAIQRDKEVTVTMKTGGSYKFKYAPLDSILTAVRAPLAENGLAITQLLDSDAEGNDLLVTMLIHSDGGQLVGRLPIPRSEGVQAFGSAITYLRRYAIQALLGIAAEEDDDGNAAAGNRASFTERARAQAASTDGSLIGTVEVGAKQSSDFELRMTPDGHRLGFRLKGDRGGILVEVSDPLASALALIRDDVVGKRVTCWGVVEDREFESGQGDKKHTVKYQALRLERIKTPTVVLPAQAREERPETADEAEDVPPGQLGLDEAAEAELDGIL